MATNKIYWLLLLLSLKFKEICKRVENWIEQREKEQRNEN